MLVGQNASQYEFCPARHFHSNEEIAPHTLVVSDITRLCFRRVRERHAPDPHVFCEAERRNNGWAKYSEGRRSRASQNSSSGKNRARNEAVRIAGIIDTASQKSSFRCGLEAANAGYPHTCTDWQGFVERVVNLSVAEIADKQLFFVSGTTCMN